MSDSQVGIVAYGSYIPATRLPLDLLHSPQARPRGPQKAVASFDEDALTMAVEAATNCLAQTDRSTIDGVYFASTTAPFREKQSAALIAKALDLSSALTTNDFTGTLRAAAGALLAAQQAVLADPQKTILVIAADARLAPPRSPLESHLGDAAAAFLIGAAAPLATLGASYTHSDALYTVWRAEHDAYLRAWEERFNVQHGYSAMITAACHGFFAATDTVAADYSKAVLSAPDARSLARAGRALGFSGAALQPGLFGAVGNCGAAFAPLLLVAALESAQAGERLLVGFYGDGAQLLSVDVCASNSAGQRSLDWYLARGRALPSYDSYLQSRQLDTNAQERRGGEGVPATVHYRERATDLSFQGQRCTVCGTVHFPACRVCYVCYAKDQFETVRLSDRRGRVMSYSFDYFFPSPEPPVIVGVCEVDNGARVYVQMTDASPAQLRCDLPVEFVFRKIHDAGNKPNYFWKSRPVAVTAAASAAGGVT